MSGRFARHWKFETWVTPGTGLPTTDSKMVRAVGGSSRGVVAFAGIHAQLVSVFLGLDVEGMVLSIALEKSGFVRDKITAANDLLKGGETAVEIANGARREGSSAGESG